MAQVTYLPKNYDLFVGLDVDKNSFFTVKEHFNLKRALNSGLIPSIYFSSDPNADLEAYTGNYLQQEIVAEGVTRNIPAFSCFLQCRKV